MMFSCCHPKLPEEAHVALILHILCGFSVDEVASAFVSTHAAMEKRITRAKKVLASSKRLFDIADAEDFTARLPAVQRALYLLFNEGLSRRIARIRRARRALPEAMRLAALLREHPLGATPADLRALRAHVPPRGALYRPGSIRPATSASLVIRIDRDGMQSSSPKASSCSIRRRSVPSSPAYHVEAAIAWVHMPAPIGSEDTDWRTIVSLYDQLMAHSPVAGRRAEPRHRHRPARRSRSAAWRSYAPSPSSDRLAALSLLPRRAGRV